MRRMILIVLALVLFAPAAVMAQATPKSEVSDPWIKGTAVGTLPGLEFDGNGVAIIGMVDRYDGPGLAVIVQNRSGRAFREVEVKIEATGPDGKLFAVGESTSGDIAPEIVERGAYAYGEVGFGGAQIGDGFTYKTEVLVYPAERESYGESRNLEIVELNQFDGRIVGRVSNSGSGRINYYRVDLMCFAGDGTVEGVFWDSFTIAPLNSGDESAFQFDVDANVDCSTFLISSTGSFL